MCDYYGKISKSKSKSNSNVVTFLDAIMFKIFVLIRCSYALHAPNWMGIRQTMNLNNV